MSSDETTPAAAIARLEQAAQVHAVAFDGGQVTWRRFGDGPPLVLLHGGHGRWLHWALNIGAMAERHTVWVPDMPGYGDSDTSLEPTIESLVDATLSTLDALIERDTEITLAGFSFGGLVAAHLAGQRGGVRQLALFGPAGHGGPRRATGKLHIWRAAHEAGDALALAGVMRHNLGVHMLHNPTSIDALALHIHTDASIHTRFFSKNISRAGGLAAALSHYRGPLLLAWGEHDVTADPPSMAAALGAGRSGCRTVVIPGAGHWVQYEASDAVNRLLADLSVS